MMKEKKIAHAEIRVAETAIELSHVLYDEIMKNDQVYKAWKARVENFGLNAKELEEAFVRKYWGKALPAARATLATMLNGPYDDAFKERIVESLSRDATLIRGRQNPSLVLGEGEGK